jgi:catechol 2,3-dioxygenase-like lactoylglutathione lyase family enzyme
MHAGLYVTDLQRSIDFYKRFFGSDPVKVKPGYAKFELADPAFVVSFIESPGNVRPDFGHLGFRVPTPEDLNIRLWQARKAGLLAEEENDTRCCYARQDKFWVTDPDGLRWEVYYFHEDVEANDEKQGAEKPCCAN